MKFALKYHVELLNTMIVTFFMFFAAPWIWR